MLSLLEAPVPACSNPCLVHIELASAHCASISCCIASCITGGAPAPASASGTPAGYAQASDNMEENSEVEPSGREGSG